MGSLREKHPMRIARFRVGDFHCLVPSDEDPTIGPVNLYSRVAAPMVTQLLQAHGLPVDVEKSDLSPLLVDTGEHRVLIDAGFGFFSVEEVAESGFALDAQGVDVSGVYGKTQDNLRAAGVPLDAIDYVVLSHLHLDHFGGVYDASGKRAFPKAQIICSRAECDFWSAPDLGEMRVTDEFEQLLISTSQDFLSQMEKTLLIVDPQPEQELVPGITLLAAPGHTPGHLAVRVESRGEALLVANDALIHPIISLAHPEWPCDLDTHPEQAVVTRQTLLAQASFAHLPVVAYHFPWPSAGYVVAVASSETRSAATNYSWRPGLAALL